MARLGKKGVLSGLVGNLVFRNLENKQIVQSQPDDVRQTKATKESGSEFRQCSKWTKQLRLALKPFLMNQSDSYMYRRFTGAFYNALQKNTTLLKGHRTPMNADMTTLAGFEFNTNSLFKDYFLPELVVTIENQNQIKVVIPEFEPKSQVVFPKQTGQCELLLYVYTTDFDYNSPIVDAYYTMPIVQSSTLQPEVTWITPELPQGRIVLVLAKVLFYSENRFTEKNYNKSKDFNPCQIVACCLLPE
jgi:hypothetical protein